MYFNIASLYRKPTAKTIAQNQLEEAQRELLNHESHAGYHAKMALYHRDNITRLTAHLKADQFSPV